MLQSQPILGFMFNDEIGSLCHCSAGELQNHFATSQDGTECMSLPPSGQMLRKSRLNTSFPSPCRMGQWEEQPEPENALKDDIPPCADAEAAVRPAL
jgi:hypothetical protein